ncbi:MAG: ATP-dependent helicase HrpB [Aliidiomarina sp.]|uniref:ATP-dependent helicase HrpB n=1 Tax=Aliidiomarina sp. TaxID=1872439 RepID=UPI0025C2BE0E|nr:ATP-dependent helicase HrpB [Aliidiomarina sp.]MCH8502393.1 ATP-dependent helicase HrpB [Aliidiomarina sp.]
MRTILAELSVALRQSVVVLQAPPGAGKSTLLPLYLLANNQAFKATQAEQIILVQPRRVAALNIAYYLAEQLGESVGERVGYWVRQERKVSSRTQLLIVTDGMFTRLIQSDPELKGVRTVIFDEFHERNLHADLGLALALESRDLRPDLQLLIMSATLPAEALGQWLRRAGQQVATFTTESRQFPIQLHYRPPTQLHRWQQVLPAVVREAIDVAEYGILVFLPGQREIRRLASELQGHSGIILMQLHGGLPLKEQRQVLQPLTSAQQQQGLRKVVLATNLAETSVTIPDIDVVVDSGRERQASFHPRYGLTQLTTRLISQASAEQRAGRAGRVRAGQCFRLWSESVQHGLAAYSTAAIETEDLSELLLEVIAWGTQPEHLLWFTPPAKTALAAARQKLQAAELLDEHNQLTTLGRQVQQWGTELSAATALALAAQQEAPLWRQVAALLAAYLEEAGQEQHTDLLARLEQILKNRGSQGDRRLYERYQYWCKKLQVATIDAVPDREILSELLLAALPLRLAQRQSGQRYLIASGTAARLQDDTMGAAEWIVASQMTLQEDDSDALIWQSLALSADFMQGWLQQHAKTKFSWEWQGKQGHFVELEEQRIGQLVVSSRPTGRAPDRERQTAALLAVIKGRGDALFASESTQQWLARIRLVADLLGSDSAQWLTENLLDELEHWAAPYVSLISTRSEAEKWEPLPALQAQLAYAQRQQLDTLLPERWLAPSERQHRVYYHSDGTVSIALKLQEVFGLTASPRFANGRITPVFELLSPAARPLHKTHDLASFWRDAYVQVRKEMRGRYPKHPWPEAPWDAQATHLTKRALDAAERSSK